METSQLICTANQLTGFYRRATPELYGFKTKPKVAYNKHIVQKIIVTKQRQVVIINRLQAV